MKPDCTAAVSRQLEEIEALEAIFGKWKTENGDCKNDDEGETRGSIRTKIGEPVHGADCNELATGNSEVVAKDVEPWVSFSVIFVARNFPNVLRLHHNDDDEDGFFGNQKIIGSLRVQLSAGYPNSNPPKVTFTASSCIPSSEAQTVASSVASSVKEEFHLGEECLFQIVQRTEDRLNDWMRSFEEAISVGTAYRDKNLKLTRSNLWTETDCPKSAGYHSACTAERNYNSLTAYRPANDTADDISGEDDDDDQFGGTDSEADDDAEQQDGEQLAADYFRTDGEGCEVPTGTNRRLRFSSGCVTLGRRVCYSHHIRAPMKRELIIRWAVDLHLGGVSRVGHPGIIIVEGPEECCQEYISRLQRLRWKHFVCRGEQTVQGSVGQTIDHLRALPRGFLEVGPGGDSMSQLSQICREADLTDLFLTSMKIYPSADKKTDEVATGDTAKCGRKTRGKKNRRSRTDT